MHAIPPVLNYAGQVAVNGEAFDGDGFFKFALVNADGTTTYWSNDGTSVDGSKPQASVTVPVNGGLYSILLGNTALQGMGAIDPAVFAQHTDAKLRVWFSDGVNGFQQLSPDRPFASVPYAFSAKSSDTALNADNAKTAESANVAMAVQAGAITKQMLGSDVLTDINATIGMNRLSTEVTEKLNQEKTTTNYEAPVAGSLIAVPYGSSAPTGYSLYQRGEPKELVWEEKAPVSVARFAYDGVEVLDGKIYFVGGKATDPTNIAERYDPTTNTWETFTSMSEARTKASFSVLGEKLYAIGGESPYNGLALSSAEVYNPANGMWSSGIPMSQNFLSGNAITVDGKIYLFAGATKLGGQTLQSNNQVLCFDPATNQWLARANMPVPKRSFKLVYFKERIWVIGGFTNDFSSRVDSYDPKTNTWQNESDLNIERTWPTAWVFKQKIHVAGGSNGTNSNQVALNSYEIYDPEAKKWETQESLPFTLTTAGTAILNGNVYLISGSNQGYPNTAFSNKVYAADLNASVEGIYDLYRKDGDAHVGTPVVQSEYADGSVTGSKMADGSVTASKIASNSITTSQLNEQILKYLKPEITAQPQPLTVYADSNVSFSVTAEGKYLTYQWKKDGVDLAGETNATLNIKDANATQHDGNYSVVVSNDFGSIESNNFKVNFEHRLELNSTVAMDMIWCPPGTFTMGSPTTEAGRGTNETEHNVSLTQGFYLGKYEVTQAQYEAVMTGVTGDRNATPSNWHGNPNRPVEMVSWDDTQVFLTRLNQQQAGNLPAGWSYVLPTESQWEYACRAGTTTAYSWGATIASSNANYNWDGGADDGNDFKQTRDVGQYAANPWGFFDMHGNVWEWTADWSQSAYPIGNPVIDPAGPASGSARVRRGGSWLNGGANLRSAERFSNAPGIRGRGLGFRVGFQKSQ